MLPIFNLYNAINEKISEELANGFFTGFYTEQWADAFTLMHRLFVEGADLYWYYPGRQAETTLIDGTATSYPMYCDHAELWAVKRNALNCDVRVKDLSEPLPGNVAASLIAGLTTPDGPNREPFRVGIIKDEHSTSRIIGALISVEWPTSTEDDDL